MDEFLKGGGDYNKLIVYLKAECIFDITHHFVGKYLKRNDRTEGQMVQAARSGKQNIVEGSSAALTSRETEIKLFNVAKASFDELLNDYKDYIRVRGLEVWDDKKQKEVREFCRHNNDSALYRRVAPLRDDTTLANLAITMIHQEIYLLLRLIKKAEKDFLTYGGIREQMSAARRKYREEQWQKEQLRKAQLRKEEEKKTGKTEGDGSDGNNGSNGSDGSDGSNGNYGNYGKS